ncbi:MAG TPA: MoaD/ThiS family protein [Pirellulales bacterium]|jgi:molybdopterin converting factor small subunit
MAIVFFPPQMRDLTGGAEQVTTQGGTLRDVLRSLDARYAGLYARVVAGERIAPGLAVSIDGSMTSRLLAAVQPHSEIHFLPAIGGG